MEKREQENNGVVDKTEVCSTLIDTGGSEKMKWNCIFRKTGLFLSCVIICMLLLIALTIASEHSSGVDDSNIERNCVIEIANSENSYIGIHCEKSNSVVQGGMFSFCIVNNFPYDVGYGLNLQGVPIAQYDPANFTLPQNGACQVINVDIDKSVMPGIYEAHGVITALFDKGKCDVEFSTTIEVKEKCEEDG